MHSALTINCIHATFIDSQLKVTTLSVMIGVALERNFKQHIIEACTIREAGGKGTRVRHHILAISTPYLKLRETSKL